jgi:1-carboxybiuret hydrolase subunit AtzG-like protein
MPDNATKIAIFVDATAVTLNMPLDVHHREGVIAAMTRLAAFAADVAAVELSDDVEIAGAFVP